MISVQSTTRLFIEHNTIEHADNADIIKIYGTGSKVVIDKNYHVRPDGANGISDSGTGTVTGTVYLP